MSWLRRIEPTEADVVRRFGDRGNVRMLALFNPLFWLLQAGEFLLRYLSSRGVLNVLRGIPAICGICAPIFLGVWVAPDRSALVARAAGRQAYHEAGEAYEKAEFYSRLLCSLTPDDDSVLLARSQLLDRMGRSGEAMDLLLLLATQRNHRDAMRLLCQKDLQRVLAAESPSTELAGVVENNLKQLIARFPQDSDGRFMLAVLYTSQQKFIEAVSLLQFITKSSTVALPQIWYSQAMLQQQLGRYSDARASASVAADQFLKQQSEQKLTDDEFLQTIRSLILAYREAEAVVLVDSRVRLAKDDSERSFWSAAKGEVCAAWSRRLRSKENRTAADVAQSIQVLFAGILAAPSQAAVVDELCKLCISEGISEAEVEKHLELALNSGVSPGLVHFILGSRAATMDPPNSAKAEEHYLLATAHDANFPGLLNNMANLIADSDTGDYHQGLKLIQQALARLPNQPQLHDTHGKLLIRLGQPVQAIAELEKALAEPTIRGEVHANLAKAWELLGNQEKVMFHTSLAKSLLQKGESK